MNRMYRAQCYLFDRVLSLHHIDLVDQYGEERRWIFGEQLNHAQLRGSAAILRIWLDVSSETIELTIPRYAQRLRTVAAASVLTCALAFGAALGFCTLRDSPVAHASTQAAAQPQTAHQGETPGRFVPLSDGNRMLVECSGDPTAIPTVILATGRGLGMADAWALVQENAEWHNFQVDLAGRSKYGQLRLITGSGHFMHRERPDAIANAIQDVVTRVRSQSH